MERARSRSEWRAAFLATVFLGACDSAPLTPAASSPEPSAPAVLSTNAPPPLAGFSASGSIPVGESGYKLIAIVPANGYVRVRTEGGIRYTVDPGYNDAPCGGVALSTGCLWPRAPFADGVATGAGIGGSHLRVYLRVDGAEWAPRELPGGELEWIVPVRAGARIEARRTGLDIFKQYCPYDHGVPCQPPHYAYILETVGLAGVKLEGVVPLRVLAPGALAGDTALLAPNQEAVFTLEAVEGITRTQWYFIAFKGSVRVLGNCSGELSCAVIPPERGVVIVYGHWNGYKFGSDYLYMKTAPADLRLTCTSYTATRGDPVTCSASATSGTLDSIRWRFVDTAGHVIDSAGPSSWGGPMIVGGTISVQAVLNGSPAADDTTITVRARRWPTPSVVPHEEPATHLPAPANVMLSGHLGDSHVDDAAIPPLIGRRIESGPNTGWWYIPNSIREIPVTVHINNAAFQAGSAWYNLQTGGAWTDPETGITHPNGYCTKSQVSTLRQLTREHEGSVSSPVMSHIRAMRVYVMNNAPQDLMEQVIAWDADVQTFTFAETINSYYRAYIFGSLTGYSAPHTTDTPAGVVPPAALPCAPRPWY